MNQRTFATTLLMVAAMSGLPPSRMAAQPVRQAQRTVDVPAPVPAIDQNAPETRERLRELLERYPPSVRQVLRLDPSLLTKNEYLATYPGLAAFLAQHPEVAHNPTFFLGTQGPEYSDRSRTISAMQDMVIGMEVAAFFITALVIIGGIARSLLEHRRWQQAMKIQTDAHTKLVDRLATNEDLLAYIQSPAGQRFLTAAPIVVEPPARAISAPVGRILWSMQTGIVLALAGTGLWLAKGNVVDEILGNGLVVLAILLIAIGIGFFVSAVASYAFSRQLGLIQSPAPHA